MVLPDGFVTIGSYSTAFEADIVRAGLEAFEIHASLVDAEIIRLNWLWSNVLGGVKVQVPEAEAAEAHRILELELGYEEDSQASDQVVVDSCPRCGSLHTDYYLDKRVAFLTWLVFNIPLFPALSRRSCGQCGWKWRTRN
jgi:hypothetical protein